VSVRGPGADLQVRPPPYGYVSGAVGSPRCSDIATNEHGAELVKEGGRRTLDKIIERMCDPTKEYSFFHICRSSFSTLWWVAQQCLVVGPKG